jgi:hypothetical protein
MRRRAANRIRTTRATLVTRITNRVASVLGVEYKTRREKKAGRINPQGSEKGA